MHEVPQIVKQRLRATMPSGHPDPDLLAAFTENCLRETERETVLQHLSLCSDCRQIVSLAMPLDTAELGRSAAPQSSRFGWPVLRWGALAACVVIVGAAVSLRVYSPQRDSELMATKTADAPAVAAPVPGANEPAASAAQNHKVLRPNRNRDIERGKEARAHVPPSTPAAEPAGEPAAQLSSAAPAPRQSITAEPNSKAERATSRRDQSVATGALDSEDKLADERTENLPGKAKPAEANAVAPAIRTDKNAAAFSLKASADNKVSAPRWTLTSDGVLQRSLDSGHSWQTVAVPTTAPVRALAAIGDQIWLGGSAGLLFHSTDAGEHWNQVTPVADGQPLAADVIAVQFTDVQHGKLTVTGDHTWTTSDGGRSWQVQ